MSKSLIVAAPQTLALIKESITLCNSIMAHRQATMQIELQRESMHHQANQAMVKEKNFHEKEMLKVKKLAEGYGIIIENNSQTASDLMQLGKDAHAKQLQIIDQISNPQLSDETVSTLCKIHAQLSQQLAKFNNEVSMITTHNMNAFTQLCDSLRDGPKTLTDVG